METQPIESIVDIWERQPLFADQSDSLVEAQKPGRLAQDPRSLALILRTAGQGVLEPVWGRLSGLDAARCWPWPGTATSATRRPPGGSRARCPDGRAEIVEHAGHAPQLQQPDAVARVLADFLDQHFGQRVV